MGVDLHAFAEHEIGARIVDGGAPSISRY
jgi:hypothetical protein